ncbi:M14 family metallopeptidase [bacterium]|nr:M14 family metallopeptidase [bacterium]
MKPFAIAKIISLGLFSFTFNSFASQILQIPNTPVNQKILHNLDLDYSCMGNTKEHLNFHLDDRAKEILESNKFSKTSLFKNSKIVEQDVEKQFNFPNQNKIQNDLGIYHTHAELVAELEATAKKFPNLTELKVVGTTVEGREIHAIVLSNKSSKQDKKSFLVTGTHHAREWISTEVPLASIQEILNAYSNDQEAKNILDTSTLVYVPMLNVDGAIFSRTKQKMWRKNRRTDSINSTGVDNNRNYAYEWGGPGASSSAWSSTFRGPEAMSEVENQVIAQLQDQYDFVTAISFHSYSELILWPWGYTDKMKSKDHKIFEKYGKKMGAIMGGYKPIQASGLYPASGVFDDYLYGQHGVLTYTIELGRQFVPRPSEVPKLTSNGSKLLRYMFTQARAPFAQAKKSTAYQIASSLENIVKSLSINSQATTYTKELQELQSFNQVEIEAVMKDLDMSPLTRIQINRLMKKQVLFQTLQNNQ